MKISMSHIVLLVLMLVSAGMASALRPTISLADESLNLVLRPSPKDGSILSLRSPLKVTGTFGAPRAGPDKAALAGRAGIALALGALNPLLALAATIETGPGVDANCPQVLAQANPALAPRTK